MKLLKSVFSIGVFILFMFFLIQCEKDVFTPIDPGLQSFNLKAKPTGDTETVGNNLSFPVILTVSIINCKKCNALADPLIYLL